jgi:hypothetical protein
MLDSFYEPRCRQCRKVLSIHQEQVDEDNVAWSYEGCAPCDRCDHPVCDECAYFLPDGGYMCRECVEERHPDIIAREARELAAEIIAAVRRANQEVERGEVVWDP